MKKATYSRTGNKVLINTLHKTFNRQCDIISIGNVWGRTQFSNFIRAYTDTECNGFTFTEGHCRAFDLGHYQNLPHFIRQEIEDKTRSIPAIFYEFRHYVGGRKKIDGYVLTRTSEHNHSLIKKWYTGNNKSRDVIDVVTEYIS